MRRPLLALALLALCVTGTGPLARAQDQIKYHDHAGNKDVTLEATIADETATGIKIKGSGAAKDKEIAPGDIIEVIHQTNVPRLTYRGYFSRELDLSKPTLKEAERKKVIAESLAGYRELLPKITDSKFAKRHVQYKIALFLAREAETDPSQAEPAIKELTKFKNDYPNSWQIFRVANLLAELQLKNNDLDGALKTYTDLAAQESLPKEVRQEFDLQSVHLLIEDRKYDQAAKKLQKLTVPDSDPRSGYVKVYAALCAGVSQPGSVDKAVAQIEDIIDKTKDRDLKAMAYNALGDCYRLNQRWREAMWEYLKVDMVYNQDKKQLTRALEQLPKVFEELKDEKRANEYKERLKKEK
jgi:hypothetical protein